MTEVEFYAYSILARSRGGQQVGSEPGVIAIHVPTGIAVVDRSELSQHRGREVAARRLEDLIWSNNRIAKLTEERDAALERAEIEHQRYLDEREENVALGEEVARMRPVVEAAERWTDSWTAEDDLKAAIATYREAKP